MQRFNRTSIILTLLLFALSFLTTNVCATKVEKYNYTFYSVVNQTNDSLGNVSIQFEDGSAQIVQVGANQSVSIIVTQNVSAVTINGQTVTSGNETLITIQSGKTVELIVKPNLSELML